MRPRSSADSRERLLFHLKTRGPQTAGRLAKRLSLSTVAVRQHLAKLEQEGLVGHEDIVSGVGRPKRTWRLTGAARELFPDTHAQLALEFFEAARDTLGEEGLDQVLANRMERQTKDLLAHMPPPSKPLAERVRALAADRRDAGYMAEWAAAGDGFLLVENHCPICAAAEICAGLCEGELDLFRTALGPDVDVQREEHIIAGDRRCTYHIRQRPA
jgi:predicted ArsR family transcriptional regulator